MEDHFVVNRAHQLYAEGDFEAAYNLYRIAGLRYGEESFEYNLKMCSKRLKYGTKKDRSFITDYFDKIYLVNLRKDFEKKIKSTNQLLRAGIEYELIEAVDGYSGKPMAKYTEYTSRPLGKLNRFQEFSEMELSRGKPFIESPGAFGYILTYMRVIEDAKKKGYERILILEDDVLLHFDFEYQSQKFLRNIDNGWKIIHFGASQYKWEHIDESEALQQGFYAPRRIDTCGSFALGIHQSIFDEVIDSAGAFDSPFDLFPLGEIYEKYTGECYVCFPNIVMPDVSKSGIREDRCQYEHGKRMKWMIDEFPFPYPKPTISVLLTSKYNLSGIETLASLDEIGCFIALYINTADGFRPLHSPEMLGVMHNDILPPTETPLLPPANHVLIMPPDKTLSKSDITGYLDVSCVGDKAEAGLMPARSSFLPIVKGRVSVIIPTYKRTGNLFAAVSSVADQDYRDKEIIVVSDHGKHSEYTPETRKIIDRLKARYPLTAIRYIEHKYNRNGASARNTGLMHATGEYICFLDDDDIYLPGRLSASVDVLIKSKFMIGGVYCGFLGWNSPGDDPGRYKPGNLTRELLSLDYKTHYLHTNTATYRRQALLAVNGFDESFPRHQDLEFNLRVLRLFNFDVVKKPLVRLKPEPSKINNRVYGLDFFKIKCRFLEKFKKMISSFDQEFQTLVFKKHAQEVKRYCDPDTVYTAVEEKRFVGEIACKLVNSMQNSP